MTLTNTDVARALREIALFLEMENVPFKPRSYEKAAQSIATCDEPCSAMLARGGVKALAEIPGVGKSIAEKVAELLTTGVMAYHEELRARTPIDVAALTAVEGVGPKGARALYHALGVTDIESLEAAARAGRIRALPRFGEKSEEKGQSLQSLISEALAQFALGTAPERVDRYDGELIYSGGDDVLAMLPTVSVLSCAEKRRSVK